MLRHSTGFRNDILELAPFQQIFTDCYINVYSGSQPASADTGATGTLLLTVSVDGGGGGLNFGASSGGVISKNSNAWSGTGVANGTAGWFRVYENTDTPSLTSTTAARIDGQIAISGGEWNMANQVVTIGAIVQIYTFSYTFPSE